MKHCIVRSFLVLLITSALSTLTFGSTWQETKKAEPKKEAKSEMTKSGKEIGPLKSFACDEACGFMIRSRSEKEILSATKTHVKKMHNEDLTEKQIQGMIKTEGEVKHN